MPIFLMTANLYTVWMLEAGQWFLCEKESVWDDAVMLASCLAQHHPEESIQIRDKDGNVMS